jgi:hypothetical protein
MRVFFVFTIFILNCCQCLFAQFPLSNQSFRSPLNLPFSFSGNFGELRPAHFHTGLDFRTQGKTGIPVYAAKDGYISRISVSPNGYGNVLYLSHPDGNTTVYGHLERFTPLVSEYVKDRQYYTESFQVNLTLSPGDFDYKKGDLIAWSGNSGSSAGPHLHFEIRNTRTENALNPLFYIPGIKDNSAPKINAVYIYPLSNESYVNRSHEKKRFETILNQNKYRLKNIPSVEVFGKIGFGVQAVDFYNGTGMRWGIYSATLICDGKPVFGFQMNNLSFDQTRYANSLADYEERDISHRLVYRLYKQPGNELNIYEPDVNDGILNLDDGKEHNIEIVVSDAFKNKSSIKFKVLSRNLNLPPKKAPPYANQFVYNSLNEFENDKVKVRIPKEALYDNLDFIYDNTPKPAGCYTELHLIHHKSVPVHKPYSLSLKVNGLPENMEDKALMVAIDKTSGQKYPVGGTFSHGWITATPDEFGAFTVMVDSVPPSIIPLSIQERKTLTENSKIRFKINDDLSGIKSYRGEIDGKWVLFEYDAKTNIISYTFDKSRMAFGNLHQLSLLVIDKRDNRAEYKASFFK